jgi:hypothetical protein
MALCSNLDQIQTTIPPLIAESSFEVCISDGLTFLSPLSISVPGTSQPRLTKAILCLPCTDRSRMTRSGLCACTMTSVGIDPGPEVHPSHSTVQLYSCLQGQTSGIPQCGSGRNCTSRSTFLGPMCVYNGPEHGRGSASPCSHRAGN